ncbi:LOW QUALITY PROTEIN: reelin-like [Panulirus ornatus]|uniref:LOW QUALITY PROTEIN: reelin-like n=1 Tax=Panulirus ornatus TaxID=150431 RepID=UPI003A846CC1
MERRRIYLGLWLVVASSVGVSVRAGEPEPHPATPAPGSAPDAHTNLFPEVVEEESSVGVLPDVASKDDQVRGTDDVIQGSDVVRDEDSEPATSVLVRDDDSEPATSVLVRDDDSEPATSVLVRDDDSEPATDEDEDRAVAKVQPSTSFGPVSSPFFFMCQYPRVGEPSGAVEQDVTLRVEFTGKRTPAQGYEPQAVYEVLVTANVVFDGFLMTGVHALTKQFTSANYLTLPASLHGGASEGLVCAVLHSHISHKPRSHLSFLWMAPPSGTGCVAFLAQGSLRDQILFKDLSVMEVCEKDGSPAQLLLERSRFTGRDQRGYIFRDDFENPKIDPSIWSEVEGGSVGREVGNFLHGSAVNFTKPDASITTLPMDLSRARQLHFALGAGSCPGQTTVHVMYGRAPLDDQAQFFPGTPTKYRSYGPVVSAYVAEEGSGLDHMVVVGGEEAEGSGEVSSPPLGRLSRIRTHPAPHQDAHDDPLAGEACTSWEEVHTYTAGASSEVHIQPVPLRYRVPGVCIKWQAGHHDHHTCWGLDDVALTTNQASQDPIVDDFDPIDPTNWMFFPGAKVKEACGSEGNSLVFEGDPTTSWTTTRLLDLRVLPPDDDLILGQYFLHSPPSGWTVEAGSVTRCEARQRMVFSGEGNRRICTPYLDARSVGVLSVSLQLGECYTSHSGRVSVSVYSERGEQRDLLGEERLAWTHQEYTLLVPPHLQLQDTRFCLEQTQASRNQTDVWALDHLRLLPWLPARPSHFFQARVNLECGDGLSQVEVQTSSDGGATWTALHNRCLPGACPGTHSTLTSSLRPEQLDRWSLVTLPLPYMSLTSNTRLRVRQVAAEEEEAAGASRWWALDNVFIGQCRQGCSGRGLCQPDGGCKCEYGYSGEACQAADRDNLVYVSEAFTNHVVDSANILKMVGGQSSLSCGVVGSGTAAVFSGRGPRAITTVDVNTTHAHFLQFHYVAGTVSDVGKCPGPDRDSESVYVHYSCDGGVTWHLLHTLHARHHKEPSHISLELPAGARGPGCRFQVWQEKHSGAGRDIWAMDDLTITSQLFNNIQLDFSDGAAANNSLRFHLGELGGGACGRDSALVFGDIIASGTSRFMETKSIGVGPSYMMQFDLVIGCEDEQTLDTPNKVVLEYSLNHGITWQLVHRPCSPSTPGCQSHFSRGTVYHASEFNLWKRVTLRLPTHTWSPTTRLRLRQTEESEVGESWAVDNLYIGRQCPGLCSGHGYCTMQGCRCDDTFHGHKCLPLHKLHRQVDTTFDDEDDISKYDFHLTGGSVTPQEEGCGSVVSGNSLYFGAPGVRQLETDDLGADHVDIIQFMLVVGGGSGSGCLPADQEETLSAGSVVLEHSTDGGISWSLLQELLPSQYRTPSLFRAQLEEEVVESESGVVRFRLWQPKHNGKNQWAVDNLRIYPDVQVTSLQADFASGSVVASPWLQVTRNHQSDYCGSQDLAQVMDGPEPVRLAVTKPLALSQDDIISFQISVGCSERSGVGRPVLLQYSKDGGVSWSLVREGCPSSALHCTGPSEPSLYRPGHHGPWTRILLPVDHRLAQGSVHLRWMQDNPGETTVGEFALRDLYIGPPCPYLCHGHGLCTAAGLCKCDKGYNGTYCGRFPSRNPQWMRDNFDEGEEASGMWERTEGASLSLGCGPHHTGNSLLFSDAGPRFATTREMDTRYIKFLVFNLQVGSSEVGGRCQLGQVPRDNVVLQYSRDNSQTWTHLQQFEPTQTTSRREAFFIPLPQDARTRQTRFRWWQGYNDMMMADDPSQGERAEWHLDNVMVLANETLPLTIFDAFDGNTSASSPWFLTEGAAQTPGCGRDNDHVLLFSGATGPKYAETWDFQATEASVVQFDIKVGCGGGGGAGATPTVLLQYSLDNGKSWKLVRELCAPPLVECHTYHLPSTYTTAIHPAWTRVTTTLPRTAMGKRTRLRLVEDAGGVEGSRAASWAIDNMYVGDSCPWMCSGHGRCVNHTCLCDEGYFGPYCVPAQVLPCELLDTFAQSDLQEALWLQAHGSEVSQRCGVVVSGSALVFFKEGLRMATTIDLDMTAGQFLQFTVQMGCHKVTGGRHKRSATLPEGAVPQEEEDLPSRAYGILVQYSSPGGITWELLKEMHYQAHPEPVFVSITLADVPMALTNATRFRVWQPQHGGVSSHTWALDNVFIGGMTITPNVLYDNFNQLTPMADAWVDWPAGQVRQMCDEPDPYLGLVFGSQEGEHALYTRDLTVDPHSVLQFDLKVGCGEVTGREHNVTLEYSSDYGRTWQTVRPMPAPRTTSSPDCLHELRTPTVFYPNSARHWRREVVPLSDLQICGRVRFRWWQGRYRAREAATPWGIDNVYIGPSCVHHCGGHGYCINGDHCVCDDDYDGEESCILTQGKPQTFNEDFEKGLSTQQFEKWSGAEVSRFCGVLTITTVIHVGSSVLGVPAFTDIDTGGGWLLRPGSVMEAVCGSQHHSLHFTSREGYRFAQTPDIMMSEHTFIQFTVALACKDVGACFNVELEYSVDQGTSWWPIRDACLPSDPDCTEYWPASTLTSDLYIGPHQVTLRAPQEVRSELTRVRFVQRAGWRLQHTWSLSHVYVGDECYHHCSGRGFCDAGVCHCQQDWTGDQCQVPSSSLPTYIVAEFSSETEWQAVWRAVVGGQTTDHCGPIATGQALHFLGGCSRYLETVDMDLREALFVQFDLRTGCLDPVSGREAGGDHTLLLQVSCHAGISWTTIRKVLLIYHQPTYVWVELPQELRCLGGRVRWWQPDAGERSHYDWAVDAVVVGGSVTPPHTLTYTQPAHLAPPLWLRRYNTRSEQYCGSPSTMHVMMSTPSEPALLQTTDLQVGKSHGVHFLLALGCGASWDSTAEPVRLEYSVDFGNSWQLVRALCLPGNSSCLEISDASVFYAPLRWNRYVYQLDHIGPSKYVRFRWIQEPSSDVSGRHQWSLRDVYIGPTCPHHCLGRGSCLEGVCHCDAGYEGRHCQHVTVQNVPYIRDQFSSRVFEPHFLQVQGGLLSEGCGGLEEPPTATFQGPATRNLLTRPVDTRSAKFVHFIAQVGSLHGSGVCRRPSHRHHNVFLQYSLDGGIRWHLLRELDHQLYTTPNREYILLPGKARGPATTFRFWQPRMASPPPAWSLDDLYIGGSEISAAYLIDKFEDEPTVSEWLFAPHSESRRDYCSSGTNGSLVWGSESPGHRAITTQELIIHEGHVLQFKVSVGCGEVGLECGQSPGVRLEYSRDGGVSGWDLVRDSCLPGSSPDPDCLPYTFHTQSIFYPDTHSHWRRVTIPLPEKTWASTTQLRWVQEVTGPGSRVTPWSLDDVYVGNPCPDHCHGRGDCVEAVCHCDHGYTGESCQPVPSRSTPLPTSLVDGFEGGVSANWAEVAGGGVGLGCGSLAPYGHGKHLYFSGCGIRQALTTDLDTRTASKLMFVLRIGSHDHTPSCHVDLSDPQRTLDKGVILQYTSDNGVSWHTLNVHDPLDFRKARRVAYSLPYDARSYGVRLRWWQPDHDGSNTDHWAIDNVEIVLAQRKDTSRYDQQTRHDSEL